MATSHHQPVADEVITILLGGYQLLSSLLGLSIDIRLDFCLELPWNKSGLKNRDYKQPVTFEANPETFIARLFILCHFSQGILYNKIELGKILLKSRDKQLFYPSGGYYSTWNKQQTASTSKVMFRDVPIEKCVNFPSKFVATEQTNPILLKLHEL